MMVKGNLDQRIELVAQAIHAAEPQTCLWDAEPTARKKRFREYARNAIKLLNKDIDVLLLALEGQAEQRACRSLPGE